MNLTAKELVHNPIAVIVPGSYTLSLDLFIELMAEFNSRLIQFDTSVIVGCMCLKPRHLSDLYYNIKRQLFFEDLRIQDKVSNQQALTVLDSFRLADNDIHYGTIFSYFISHRTTCQETIIAPSYPDYLDNMKVRNLLPTPGIAVSLSSSRKIDLEL